jgi:hypothetical protein
MEFSAQKSLACTSACGASFVLLLHIWHNFGGDKHGYMRPQGMKKSSITQIIKCKAYFDLKAHSHHTVNIFFSYAEYPTCPFLNLRNFLPDHRCLLRAFFYSPVRLEERR